jgi:hypothetical protein
MLEKLRQEFKEGDRTIKLIALAYKVKVRVKINSSLI